MPILDLQAVLMFASWLLFLVSVVSLLWVTWRHHRSGKQSKANFHDKLSVEMAWTLVPAVIVLALLWPIAQAFLAR